MLFLLPFLSENSIELVQVLIFINILEMKKLLLLNNNLI